MESINLTASEVYSWIYSLSKEMVDLDETNIKMRCYVYEQALNNYTKGKIPIIYNIDEPFYNMDRFSRQSVLDSFIVYIKLIDDGFPLLSQCISELFKANSKLIASR